MEPSQPSVLPQALLDVIGPAIYSTTVDGIVTHVNRGAEVMLGYRASEMVDQPCTERWHDAAEVAARASELTRELGRLIEPGFAVFVAKDTRIGETREWTYVRKDGGHVPVLLSVSAVEDEAGVPLGFLGIAQDLSERKRLESAQTANIKALGDFKSALDVFALVTITSADGTITYVNDTTCAITQYSREELIGENVRLVNSAHHSRDFYADLWRTITDVHPWHGEIRNRAKDGSHYWVTMTIVPFLDRHGAPERYMALSRDITKRKAEEDNVVRLNIELSEQSATLNAVNRELESFSHSVSHDLRAPLRGMDGFSQALLEDYGHQLDETARDYLRRIRAASQRMGQLIDDLLGLSMTARSEMIVQPVDITRLARDVIADLQSEQRGRDVEWEVDEGMTAIGDRRLLRVAFSNLLANALKFTGKCARARIACVHRVEGGEQVFVVRDNGAGFDMTYAGPLFGAFQRLHRDDEFPGTGIGLATVQRIVHRHGGRIWADAQPGKGATFSFTLQAPIAQRP